MPELRIPFFQVDAFAEAPFEGNPAAVCVLDSWLPDPRLAAIAAENNLSETAFLLPAGEDYELRWFTPRVEVDLCGHATLASAHVVFERLAPERREVRFHTRMSGVLTVRRESPPVGERLVMDFPAQPPRRLPDDRIDRVADALGARPAELWAARDHVAVFASERDVAELRPDFALLSEYEAFAVVATAPADSPDLDFVSRFFAPAVGVPEDPVTGSAHVTLAPLWADRLGKTDLRARQLSQRGGTLSCRLDGDRVHIAGRAVLVIDGTLHLSFSDNADDDSASNAGAPDTNASGDNTGRVSP